MPIKIFTICFLLIAILSSTSCHKDEGVTVDNTPAPLQPSQPESKPLPTECFQQVLFAASWEQDPEAYQYEIGIGYDQYNYPITIQWSGASKEFSKLLDRNFNYFIRISKRTQHGLSATSEFHFFIPSCNERSKWKEQHPEYNEPISYVIDWNK